MLGLGYKYWNEVISTLRFIIPVYDKVNKIISLGKDDVYRFIGISENVFPNDLVLDAGSGFGNMSIMVYKITKSGTTIIMYDPLIEMLKKSRLKINVELLSSGVFEHMPFRDDTFDAIVCGYSLRDAIDLETAISEIHRILKNNGRFVIVDLGKPDNSILRAGVSFYLKYIIKILAFLAAGEYGLRFKMLYGTYLKWPQNNILQTLLQKKFSKVEFKRKMVGGSIIVSAIK